MIYIGTLDSIKLVNRDFENNIGSYIIKINNKVLRLGVVSGRNLIRDLLEEGFNLNDKCNISGPIMEMSEKEIEEQKRSFAYGNAKLDCPYITREDIDRAADEINKKRKLGGFK